MKVEEMIEDIEKRSNELDIIATITNVYETFYKHVENPYYCFLRRFFSNQPGVDLVWKVKDKNKGYALNCVDGLLIEEINKNLSDGILLWAAKVEIENDKCNIISTKNYQYSLEELNIPQEEFDIDYNHDAFCIAIRKDKDMEISLRGDFKSDFVPLFYSLDELTEDNEYYGFSYSNPIVKMVIKAIYESLVFK